MFNPYRTAGVALVALALSGLVRAQAPTPSSPSRPAAQPQAAGDRLPVRRVVLYKSGVGYFEHLGRIRGNQTVTIDFTSGQLNDVLKSLTALDLDGGRVLGVSYNSEAGLDRRLSALRLPVGPQTSRAAFFSALRGARLEVKASGSKLAGRLLSVERISRKTESGVIDVDTLSIVTDAGEVQTFALDAGVSVRLLEADLHQEVGRYLSLIGSVRDQDLRRVSIATSGTGDRNLFVSYISEVPVWKPTYRIVLPAAGTARKPILQGWAIIDNTVGEDWTNVELSLVAGAPQSFIQRLSQPYYVLRPIVPLPQHVSLAPQTHRSALVTSTGTSTITGTVRDASGGILPGVTVRLTRSGALVSEVATSAQGRYSITGVAPGTYEVRFSLAGFRPMTFQNIQTQAGMEAVVDARLQVGSVTEELTVTAAAPVVDTKRTTTARESWQVINMTPGVQAGVNVDGLSGVSLTAAQQSDATAGQLGDLFEYKLKTPVSIPKNQSALVPILSGEVEAEKVSLWNATSGRARPLRAVWLTNGTGATLDAGPFSVTESDAFAGEGLLEPLKAGERRLLSYAADLAVQIDARSESVPTETTRIRIARGVVTHETEERHRRTYTVRNEDAEARVLVVEHPVRHGFTVGGTVTPSETTGAWHRFRLPVAGKTTATFTVDDVRPVQTEYSVSSLTGDQIAVFVKGQLISADTEAALTRILAQQAEVARLTVEIAARETERAAIDRDQGRVRENLKALKGSLEERQLVQRYVKQLDDQENRMIALRKELEALESERQKAQAELEKLIEALSTTAVAGGL
jgi:hypothetical protein